MANDLAEKRCTPCEGGTAPLATDELAPLLAQLSGWQVQDGKKLRKSYRFKNFVQAVDFVNALTPVVEAEGHHPDLFVKWGAVRVDLWTHAAGGLTENDFIVAAKLDRLARQRGTRT